MQDTSLIKQRIMSIIQERGPSLPVHISQRINSSILFTSAFLSELVSEKKVYMTIMRVGSSPIYYFPEQKEQIQKYVEHLKDKEREAFNILKDKKILKDSEQQPAIRVALRQIKDFAIPFKNDGEIYWRFFTTSEQEVSKEFEKKLEVETIKEKPLDIFSKDEPEKKEQKKSEKKSVSKPKIPKRKTTTSQKRNEKLFEKVKNYLNSKSIEIEDIIGFSKNELILRIKENSEEKLLIAFNKKNLNEKDILKCHIKAQENKLPYKIFILGEQTKKITNLIEAIKNLENIETIE